MHVINVRDSINAQGEQLKTILLEMTSTAIDSLSEYVERTTIECTSTTK